MLPETTIVGTLTEDPTLRYTSSGDPVANVNIAANERRYNRETGQWENTNTTFLRASIWRQYAENVAETLSKGSHVIATGVLKQRTWQDDTGTTRSSFELDAREIGFALRWHSATPNTSNRTSTSTAEGNDTWYSEPTK